MSTPAIRSRKPTGQVPYPFLLLEGEEKSGKSWAAAELSASEKVGQTYWIDLGEGAADEYGAIPGARYKVIEHDGTYADILDQIVAVKAEAQRAADAGEPPVVLVIDSLSALWEMLKDWASELAKGTAKNKAKLAQDPTAEVEVSRNLWNLAGARYRRVITRLLTFPGIVVGTARGKEVSATDPSTGQPYRDGRRDYRVEGHRSLPFDATVWVRMSRTAKPLVVGARSVHVGIKPGADDPKPIEGEFSLERLVFDLLKCEPGKAHARKLTELSGGELTAEERAEDPKPPTVDDLLRDVGKAANSQALDAIAIAARNLAGTGNLVDPEFQQVREAVTARRTLLAQRASA